MSNEINPLYSNLRGLTDSEVSKSRQEHGENTLTPPKRTPLWKLYLDKYKDPIIKILLVAAVISLALACINGEFIESVGIILAIVLATTIGFWFEMDAAKKFNVLTALGEESPVKVRRDGKVVEVARKDIVVGDVVIIEVGDEIPADGTLIESTDLQIDESSLTGEPIITKHADPAKNDTEATYASSKVLRSTMVMNGRGTYQVTEVGDATEIGKVSRASTEITAVKTPLNLQLDKLAKLISKFGIGISVAAFIIFLTRDIVLDSEGIWASTDYLRMAETVLQYFMMAVTLIVMAVPEGMPMAVTLSLALNMRRMLKNNNLVRKLHACETMGAVTVICTDKTGTLTQNKMQVADMKQYDADDALFRSAIALNTTAHLDEEGGKGIGNPTEVALLLWLEKNGVDYRALRKDEDIEAQLPFSTERKYMATIGKIGGKRILMVKGAPEIVASFCDITPEARQEIGDRLRGYQNQAMRTLAFAYRVLADGEQADMTAVAAGPKLTFQAVTAISDPIRLDVPDAVKQCVSAGINVKIVTGDTSATAIEIARQIGIWNAETPAEAQITGPDFAALSDDEAYQRVAKLRVMSRARPTDKQRLVNLLQKRGEVVAVTGDGTNDAPALNHAHVGLSLGSGTSVAKEASDMTLLDDSFGSIVNAVMWGRSLYRNIQRFLYFQLIVNVTALLLVLGGSVIGTELPLTVTQILWVNLIMDTFAALALASLPPSREVMKDKPRKQSDFIITRGMAQGIIIIGLAFFAVLFAFLIHCNQSAGDLHVHELSIFFTTFVMLQFWNLFNAKSFGSNHSAFHAFTHDNGLLLVLAIILGGQWIIVTFGGKMFRTDPLSLQEWLVIIAATSPVMWIGEIWRCIKRVINK
ncbi:calcium-translocating P-type ATPase, PMCA-type [Marseilla massiliensis]|uniref:P-type Ca(2+) transporter n=1 Tax=Marseilla massiliensis TaxID=1841864 RepID=A0A938WUG5_9BACT|nr:calcium-translocating P-type ATPase, PMCA-type [Marseilla massiliensis]MBM6674255.1 calcium-translocating P-type ATPase, PMCA-type [Marseilla massiliensis]